MKRKETEEEDEPIFVIRNEDQPPQIDPIYDSDSTVDDPTNTVGNIPLHWYDNFPHIGYSVDGQKIMRPAKGDDLDKFLAQMDDPNAWKTIHDKLEGKDVVLNKEELQMLKRIQQHSFPDADYDPYQPTIEWFTSKTETLPLNSAPEPKSRFVPSKWEASKIMKIARAIKAGLITPNSGQVKTPSATIYDIWENDNKERRDHIAAPKLPLPEHIESYNPPAEYILSSEEEKEWNAMDPEDRPQNFFPRKFDALRKVPGYDKFIKERFERCLDLYLCPRTIKQKVHISRDNIS